MCSGSIINKWQFLTAAHCVYGRDINLWRITAGRSEIPDFDIDKRYRRVLKIKIHRKYDTDEYHDDIAIVTVNSPFNFRNKNIQPIRLETSNQIPKEGDICSVAGWGAMSQIKHQLY